MCWARKWREREIGPRAIKWVMSAGRKNNGLKEYGKRVRREKRIIVLANRGRVGRESGASRGKYC